jgi:ribosomal 50S subunit-recycling heat shock protein
VRVDQFLKKTLLLKQRGVAKELCDKKYIKINGQYTKPSKHVSAGDVIEIETMKGVKQYAVLMVPTGNVKKGERHLYYEERFDNTG